MMRFPLKGLVHEFRLPSWARSKESTTIEVNWVMAGWFDFYLEIATILRKPIAPGLQRD
jgi:hypothetical protein